MARFQQFMTVVSAWNRRDIDAALAGMADDIVWHFAAGALPPLKGKAAARAFLMQFGDDIAEARWRIFHHAESRDRLFVEGVDDHTNREGVQIAPPYCGVIEFRGELIVGWRDYFDMKLLERLKASKPMPQYVRDLIDRPALAGDCA